MTRQDVIDLIHNEYDPVPSYYKLNAPAPMKGDNWDDGSERIADAVMARIEALEAALREIASSSDDDYAEIIARAALDQSSPPKAST